MQLILKHIPLVWTDGKVRTPSQLGMAHMLGTSCFVQNNMMHSLLPTHLYFRPFRYAFYHENTCECKFFTFFSHANATHYHSPRKCKFLSLEVYLLAVMLPQFSLGKALKLYYLKQPTPLVNAPVPCWIYVLITMFAGIILGRASFHHVANLSNWWSWNILSRILDSVQRSDPAVFDCLSHSLNFEQVGAATKPVPGRKEGFKLHSIVLPF